MTSFWDTGQPESEFWSADFVASAEGRAGVLLHQRPLRSDGSGGATGLVQGAARWENRRARNWIKTVTFDGLGPPGGVTMCSAIVGRDQSVITASSRPSRRSRQTT